MLSPDKTVKPPSLICARGEVDTKNTIGSIGALARPRPVKGQIGSMADSAAGVAIFAESDAEDQRLLALIQFLDLGMKIIRPAGAEIGGMLGQLSADDRCLIISARFLAKAVRDDQEAGRFRSFLAEGRRQVFVYGSGYCAQTGDAVRRLTNGAFRFVPEARRRSDEGYHIAAEPRVLTRQLSDVSFDDNGAVVFPGLIAEAGSQESDVLISRGGIPVFTRTRLKGRGSVFVLAHQDIADVHQRIGAPWSLRQEFLGLIPVLLFFRSALKDSFWQAPHAYANLIIDDPLLWNPYGSLDYGRLLSAMDRKGFFTTVAFIPRNFKRSRDGACRVFRQRPDRYGLCVHGLSHIHHEFGCPDPLRLKAMAQTSLQLMGKLERRTRLPWDDVMVFPQGRFSANAMRALKYGGFSAAVNSLPESADDQGGQRIGDMIEAAHLRYDDFPLFHRRYPTNIPDLAIDLFLGRPALVVEHQGWFRAGYDHVEEFIGRVNALDQSLRWRGLRDVILGSYWHRTRGPLTEVRIFCGRARIENGSDGPQEFLVRKKESSADCVDSVTVDGEPIEYSQAGRQLEFRFVLAPRQTAVLEIRYQDPSGGSGRMPSLKETPWAAIRRHLAAFRDHTVSQSDILAGAVSRLARVYRACRKRRDRVTPDSAGDRTDIRTIRKGGE